MWVFDATSPGANTNALSRIAAKPLAMSGPRLMDLVGGDGLWMNRGISLHSLQSDMARFNDRVHPGRFVTLVIRVPVGSLD
jgi:hypothetical protein